MESKETFYHLEWEQESKSWKGLLQISPRRQKPTCPFSFSSQMKVLVKNAPPSKPARGHCATSELSSKGWVREMWSCDDNTKQIMCVCEMTGRTTVDKTNNYLSTKRERAFFFPIFMRRGSERQTFEKKVWKVVQTNSSFKRTDRDSTLTSR